MSEDQNIPKQPLNEETTAETGQQDSTISRSETKPTNMEVHHHPDLHHRKKH